MINSAQLWDIYETQLKTIGVVLRALNSKQPLLRLPTEILNQIMEHIPHSRALTFRPVWQSCAANSLDHNTYIPNMPSFARSGSDQPVSLETPVFCTSRQHQPAIDGKEQRYPADHRHG